MQLTETEIRARLAADFGGSLLFQPLRAGVETRPVAQLATIAQLLPRTADLRALADPGTAQRLREFLHHEPAPRQGRR